MKIAYILLMSCASIFAIIYLAKETIDLVKYMLENDEKKPD